VSACECALPKKEAARAAGNENAVAAARKQHTQPASSFSYQWPSAARSLACIGELIAKVKDKHSLSCCFLWRPLASPYRSPIR